MGLPGLNRRAAIFDEMASFLASGMALTEALDALRAGFRDTASWGFIDTVAEKLKSGATTAQALESTGLAATDVALLTAAEQSGTLDVALRQLAESARQAAETRTTIIGGMIYPAVIFHLAILLPTLPQLISGTSIAELAPRVLGTLLVVYAALFLLALTGYLLWRATSTGLLAESLVRAIPLVGGIQRSSSQARFLRLLGSQLDVGVNVYAAFAAAGRASHSARLAQLAANSTRQFNQGYSAEQIIAESDYFPQSLAAQSLTAGRHGQTTATLRQWAEVLEQKADRKRKSAIFWLGQLIYLAAICYAGWQIISMYAGVLDQYSKILDSI